MGYANAPYKEDPSAPLTADTRLVSNQLTFFAVLPFRQFILPTWFGFCVAALEHFSCTAIDFSLQPLRSHFTHSRLLCSLVVKFPVTALRAEDKPVPIGDALCCLNCHYRYMVREIFRGTIICRLPCYVQTPEPSWPHIVSGESLSCLSPQSPRHIPSIQDNIVNVLFCGLRCTLLVTFALFSPLQDEHLSELFLCMTQSEMSSRDGALEIVFNLTRMEFP